jgi:hypothetical protein
MLRVVPVFVLLLLSWAALPVHGQRGAAEAGVVEVQKPPTADWVLQVLSYGETHGWDKPAAELRELAFRAYREEASSSERWLQLARWGAWFGRSERDALREWLDEVKRAGVGHAAMAEGYEFRGGPLGQRWSREMKRTMLLSEARSREFFATISPLDNPMRVMSILADIAAAHPEAFTRHFSLALAIAVVFDTPPPVGWPHYQVGVDLLPRRLPDPVEAFAFWVEQQAGGELLVSLERLSAAELRFVVDTAVSFDELRWAQRSVRQRLATFAEVYDAVAYRMDRVEQERWNWPGRDYRLATILAEGGICVDQAFFAAQVGKAKGVPTLIFRGPGLDGRHAWFGFRESDRSWRIDAGRLPEQGSIAGRAHDPQTWGDLSDHELLFLTEGFRRSPAYRPARLHGDFAHEFLAAGHPVEARDAARRALALEPRLHTAWRSLVIAMELAGASPLQVDSQLRLAAAAVESYPDLRMEFIQQLADRLRARGDGDRADAELAELRRTHRADRIDLAVEQARLRLHASMATDPVSGQLEVFQSLLAANGGRSGVAFFDRVVLPFAQRLLRAGHSGEALRVFERTQQVLNAPAGSQLARELEHWLAELRPAAAPQRAAGGDAGGDEG